MAEKESVFPRGTSVARMADTFGTMEPILIARTFSPEHKRSSRALDVGGDVGSQSDWKNEVFRFTLGAGLSVCSSV